MSIKWVALACGHVVSTDMLRIWGGLCPDCEQRKDDDELEIIANQCMQQHFKTRNANTPVN